MPRRWRYSRRGESADALLGEYLVSPHAAMSTPDVSKTRSCQVNSALVYTLLQVKNCGTSSSQQSAHPFSATAEKTLERGSKGGRMPLIMANRDVSGRVLQRSYLAWNRLPVYMSEERHLHFIFFIIFLLNLITVGSALISENVPRWTIDRSSDVI